MNSEKLQKWALIAEIFGGIAVIVTLIFLIIETRENNELQKASTYDSLVADIANWRMDQISNSDLAEIMDIATSRGQEALNESQTRKFRQYNVVLFLHYERAFLQWSAGNLSDSNWERFRVRICEAAGNPAFESNIGVIVDSSTNEAFTNYRKTQCE